MKAALFLTSMMLAFGLQVYAQDEALLSLRYEENYTPTYDEIIGMYRLLDTHYENAVLIEKGLTDSGKPLHLFVINNKPDFDPESVRKQGKAVLLINNGIHAGEPAGIEASLQFADDLLRNQAGMAAMLEDLVVVIIPVYNIGGLLNRSAFNRANQTTPYETGFRGNAGNLDLNRDFTKCDSENARSFTAIFHEWNPDVLLDTHTTNGSDHQYSITLIPPQPDSYPAVQGEFIREDMLTALYGLMQESDYELIPYVDWFYDDPREGIQMTQESPRYSSGFARMFHSYGMITENLIYKPYPDRVKSTYWFIRSLSRYMAEKAAEIIASRKQGVTETRALKQYPLHYTLDSAQYIQIEFKGYEFIADQKSKVTGLPIAGYDTSAPFTDSIRYYDRFKAVEYVKVPEYYLVPQAWKRVTELLESNGIECFRLEKDTVLEAEFDYITDFTSPDRPYNGHFYHDEVVTVKEVQQVSYFAGDYVIPVRQEKMAYLIEMLEPRATDSFFRWNFFDAILDSREYFSPYGFEENALKYLNDHPDFKKKFDKMRMDDPLLAKDHNAQLSWIYNNSEWAEKSWRRYPVGRIFQELQDLESFTR